MNRIIRFLTLSLAFLFWWCGSLFAEYTFVLKNGRRITVQNYREEGGTIKFYGLGGEIGIPRDQIQSIKESGEGEGRGMVFPGVGKTPPRPTGKEQEVKKGAGPSPSEEAKVSEKSRRPTQAKEKSLTPEEILEEKKAQKEKEEKEYQKRVEGITNRIKALRNRYALATRGSSGPEPSVMNRKAGKARTAEQISRLRKFQQRNPAGVVSGRAIPRVGVPPKPLTGKQRELGDMRKRLVQLTEERKKLIEEMKRKNFDTSSLFLE